MRLNILVNGFSKSILNLIIETEKKFELNYLSWITHNSFEQEEINKNIYVADHFNNYDLCRMQFFENNTKGERITEEFLEIINKELPIVLDMMSRFEGYKSFSNNDKITYIYKQIYYWFNYISSKKINLYIQFDTPHDVYDYIIYIIAKYLKTRLIILQQSSFFYCDNNQNNILLRMITPTNDLKTGKNINQKSSSNEYINFKYNQVKLAYDLNRKISAFTKRRQLTESSRINRISKFFNLARYKLNNNNYVIQNLDSCDHRISFLQFRLLRFIIHRKTNFYRKYLTVNSKKLKEFKEKFIYFPLQYQPERTSCPEGKFYFNQYLAILRLRSYLNPNINILVKEHPKQLQNETVRNQMYRSTFFYDEIKKLKNVYFIDTNISSQKILSNKLIEGTATIKGNIILESIMNNVPSFYFGNTIWSKLEKSYDCSDENVLTNINNLLKSKSIFDETNLEKSFFKCIEGSFISIASIHDEFNKNDQNRFNNYIINLIK